VELNSVNNVQQQINVKIVIRLIILMLLH